jgi:hypothetical protein
MNEILFDIVDKHNNKVYLSMYRWAQFDIMFQLKDFGTYHLIMIRGNELHLEHGIGNVIIHFKSIELDKDRRLKIVGIDVV